MANPFEDPGFVAWIEELNEIPMEDVADEYGIERNGALILCPDHDDYHFGSCRIHHNRYYCFACHGKGDNLKLVKTVTGYSYVKAAQDLATRFHIPIYYADRNRKGVQQIDRMPLSKTQLIVLGLQPNPKQVFLAEANQLGKAGDFCVADNDPEGISYLTGSVRSMSITKLYQEDKEGFFAIVAGKFYEYASQYKYLYEHQIWDCDLFSSEVKCDIQHALERNLEILNSIAEKFTAEHLIDLSYFKMPVLKKAQKRYSLQL